MQSIAHADVLLELFKYRCRVTENEWPVQEWLFNARRLHELDPEAAIYRFGFLKAGPPEHASREMEQRLPPKLMDVCLGLQAVPPPPWGNPE